MKKLFAIVLCVCMVFCITACTGPSSNNDAETTDPQTAPETKTIYLPLSSTTYTSHEKLEVFSNVEYKYDENNFLTEIINYRKGEVTKQTFVTCDAYGNVISTRSTRQTGSSTIEEVIQYTRDSQGNSIKEEYFTNGQLGQTTVYTYDAAGNQITKDIGALYHEYTYNADGQLTGSVGYDKNGNSGSMKITFDAEGRPIRRTQYNQEGNERSFVEYTYEGNTMVATHFDGKNDLTPNYYRYTYDENGNVIQLDCWGAMNSQTATEYTYLALEVPLDSVRQPYEE